jgi:DNA-binding CsgD family transcriptional regulator
LRAGASGFLLKDAPEERLTTAIRVVADGGSLFAPSVTRRLIEEFAKRPDKPATDTSGLTEREAEVLRLVARGLSNAEIAQTLFLTENTVKTHVARVLMKLGVRDRVQAVVAAYESGLVRRSGEPWRRCGPAAKPVRAADRRRPRDPPDSRATDPRSVSVPDRRAYSRGNRKEGCMDDG